ncbi:MAG TPA: hypothetical protein VFY18_01735 [Candidatus Limnocylindrales bacterium]|nr:hypothetical protein [Candidatus Limnocylindrales bacterium]
MDDDMQAIEAGTELELRLARYAHARLTPDPRATARTRARVMREARLSFEAARIAVHVTPTLAASHASLGRRALMPFLAAAVWLGIAAGTISAAQPGGPLYPTRMWIETAVLPGAPSARTAAELERLDDRLAEALAAASRGDWAAVAASLDAYGVIADEASAQSTGNDELAELVAAALDRHRAVLTTIAASLADKGNTTAAEAIERNVERAIQHNAAVLEVLDNDRAAPQGGNGGATGGSGGSGGSDGNGGTGGAGGGGSAGHTPGPHPTPKAGDDKPTKTPKPERTPASDRSPRN